MPGELADEHGGVRPQADQRAAPHTFGDRFGREVQRCFARQNVLGVLFGGTDKPVSHDVVAERPDRFFDDPRERLAVMFFALARRAEPRLAGKRWKARGREPVRTPPIAAWKFGESEAWRIDRRRLCGML